MADSSPARAPRPTVLCQVGSPPRHIVNDRADFTNSQTFHAPFAQRIVSFRARYGCRPHSTTPHRVQENFGPGFGPLTPKHHPKPTNTRYQRASNDSSIYNATKSAKPPSPVQIRAAPPKSLGNFQILACALSVAPFLIAPKWTRIHRFAEYSHRVNH